MMVTPDYQVAFRLSASDPLQQALDSIYEYKDDISTKVCHRNRLNLFYELLHKLAWMKLITNTDRALDIGSNGGYFSYILSRYGFKYVQGIDIVQKAVDRANQRFGSDDPGRTVEFYVQNAEDLDRTDQYDLVLCTEVIEHTRDPQKVIDTIEHIVNPGGIAVITLPNACSLPFLAAYVKSRLLRQNDPDLIDHLKYPFFRSMRLFRKPQLRLIYTTGTNLIFNRPILRLIMNGRVFPHVNWLNYQLSQMWPMKYFSQFFFMVFRHDA
jgi:2-polyprenyl-3-methyl-5-hydroxy-6-metoxy-1,4-benzoquinol methylase